MGLEIHITLQGVEELLKRMDSAKLLAALDKPMVDSLREVRDYLSVYPGKQSRKKNPGKFVSDRQRRFVMASIKDGRIQIPYVRTNALRNSWRFEVHKGGGTLSGRVYTELPHAQWVQGSEKQAAIHRGNWRTDRMALEEKRAGIIARFLEAAKRALRGARA